MSRRHVRLAVALALSVVVVVACNPHNEESATTSPAEELVAKTESGDLGRITPVKLVDQDGHAFGQAELGGHVWIGAMMLTSCTMMCPLMAERMAYLQKLLPSHAPSIRLLSITVDPEKDTPDVLLAYGKRFHREPATWTFVTGETAPIFEAVNAGYRRAPSVKGNFDHGNTLVLVGRDGRIEGYYGKDDGGVARIFADADRLALASSESASR